MRIVPLAIIRYLPEGKSDFEVSSGYLPGGGIPQLPGHLFDLPEYNTATSFFIVATINDLMRR